ncbi:PAS domain-containing protein [Glycocaulis sp.]
MASTRTYQDAFNAMPGACALICADGKIIAASTRFERLFGERAMISRPLSGLYADPLDALTSAWHRRQTAGAPESAVLRDAGGAPFPARISVTALPSGVRMAVVETVSDTGRHQDALQRARRRVDAAFEAGSAGAYSVDFPARKVVVSGLLERFFGPQASDTPVSLSRWLAAIHPEDLAAMRVALSEGADDPMDVFSLTCRMRTAADVWVWTRHDLRVVERQPNGEPSRITGLVHDIAAPAGDNPADARVRARLDLAMKGLELSTWEFDFDTLEGLLEGPITRALDAGTGKVSVGEEMLRARLHPDDAERVHAAFMGLQYGGSYDETFRILSPAGHWLWFRSWGEMLPSGGESGSRPRKAFGFWQQLPGQRDDIAAPLDSDIAGVLDRAGLSGWAYDFQARTLTLSGPVLTAVGLTSENSALAIEDWRARVHPDDRPAMDRATEKLLTTGNAHVEYRVRTEGGSWIWLSLRGGVCAQTAKGEALRASGVFAEATRRKEAERRLADSESLLSHALTSAALGAWELDYEAGEFRPRGEIREMLELEAGQDWIASKAWLKRVHPEDREALIATIEAIVADTPGRVRSVEYRALDPRTKTYRWVEGRGSRLGPESERADCAGIVLDISDRKALEESLARSEERLARALTNARQGTWRLDFASETVELSEFARAMMGLPDGHPGTMSLDDWRALIHPEDAHICEAGVEGMVRGEPLNAIYRVGKEREDWRWIEDRGAISAWDSQDRPAEAIGTLVDITQRRELEIELAEREARLGEAMDAGLSAIWSIDHETGEQSVRGKLLEWMGRDIGADKVTLEDWNRIIHPDDRDLARKALAELMNGQPGGPIDYRLRSADGWRWVRAKGETTARDKDGNPIRSGGVVVDITAEHAFAEALDAERERLDRIYRTTPVMMVSLSPDGHVVAVSEYWLSSLGYERDQVVGKPYDAFLTPASAEKMIALGGMEALIEAGTMRDVHARLVKADGEVIDIISSASVEFGPDGAPIAAHGISIDVTEKLAQARNLKHYAEELERTNRELDRFATVASHDLQEPLRKISAFASLIKRRHHGEFDHETDRSLDFLVDAAGRMRRVIDDLLTYSRTAKRMLEFRNVDMNAAVRELLGELDILVTEARAQIEIGELPVIKGDPTLLRLLIQNLITNALKYRKDEGVRIAISAVQEGVHWRFTVSDNGIGFDPRFAEKVFAPFQRLHGREDYEGTGIGLAICQQAVERHGGNIWVETEPGKGASFHFTLPAGHTGERDAA